MREASYLTDADRLRIMETVERARKFCCEMQALGDKAPHENAFYNSKLVGVRCATYCGPDTADAIAVVEYGPGGSTIFEIVYRAKVTT